MDKVTLWGKAVDAMDIVVRGIEDVSTGLMEIKSDAEDMQERIERVHSRLNVLQAVCKTTKGGN